VTEDPAHPLLEQPCNVRPGRRLDRDRVILPGVPQVYDPARDLDVTLRNDTLEDFFVRVVLQ